MYHVRKIVPFLLVLLFITFSFVPSVHASSTRITTFQQTDLAKSYLAKSKEASLKTQFAPGICNTWNKGETYTDPVTGALFRCECITQFTPDQGTITICKWTLVPNRPPFPGNTWENFNSSLYMDVEGVSTNNGARIHQWTYTGANNQWWYMESNNFTGDGYLKIVSKNSGKCLGVSAGALNQGAPIVQWDCTGSIDQSWAWAWTGNYTQNRWPIFNIINMNSHMCLGISGGSLQVGGYAVQWACNGSYDQQWY